MSQIVDARGLACPQPVVQSRKALEKHDTIVTIVDNMTAVENIRRMAASLKCIISEEKKVDGYYLTVVKPSESHGTAEATTSAADTSCSILSQRVLVISQDVMGRGDDNLGKILIKSFFHTLAETSPAPDIVVFFNTGVRLVAEGSEVLEDILALEKTGARILSCGTCLDYFNIKDLLGAGSVTNMYEIKELLLGGSSVTTI
jgi:selenium metabolism protein YedF